jgi:hypothetical protein
MPEYKNNPDGPDNPFIRFLLYIIFSIGGAVVGGIFSLLELSRGHRYHYNFYEVALWFILGAIPGSIVGFVTVWQVCRQIDSDNK